MRTYYALIDEFYTLDLPGECKLENMRTLCVACHADVTKAQCAERRIARKKAKKQLKETISGLITSEKSGKNMLKVLVLTDISFSLSLPPSYPLERSTTCSSINHKLDDINAFQLGTLKSESLPLQLTLDTHRYNFIYIHTYYCL